MEVQLLGQGDREGVTRLRRRLRRVPLKLEQSETIDMKRAALLLFSGVDLGEAQVLDLDLGVNIGHCRRSKPLNNDTQGRQERHGNTGHSRSHRPG